MRPSASTCCARRCTRSPCAATHQARRGCSPRPRRPPRSIGDRRSHALVLAGRSILAGVRGEPDDCLRPLAAEALAAAEDSGDPTLVVAALHGVVRSTMQDGDLDGLRRRRDADGRRGDGLAVPVRRGPRRPARRGGPPGAWRAGRAGGTARRRSRRPVRRSAWRRRPARRRPSVGCSPWSTASSTSSPPSPRSWRPTARPAGRRCAPWPSPRAGGAPRRWPWRRACSSDLDGPDAVRLGTPDERDVVGMMAAEVAAITGDRRLAALARAELDGRAGRFAVLIHATLTLGPGRPAARARRARPRRPRRRGRRAARGGRPGRPGAAVAGPQRGRPRHRAAGAGSCGRRRRGRPACWRACAPRAWPTRPPAVPPGWRPSSGAPSSSRRRPDGRNPRPEVEGPSCSMERRCYARETPVV